MSDREILKKLFKIASNQQKIISKLAGVDWAVADNALRTFVLNKASGLVAPYGGIAKASLSRAAAADNAATIEYDVDVKLLVPNEADKPKVEQSAAALLNSLQADLAAEASKQDSPLKGCVISADSTVTVIVSKA